MRAVIIAAILILILAFPGAPLEAQSTPPTFLFLLEGKGVPTGTIHVFSVNSVTGAITEVSGSPFNAGLIPQSLAVDPSGRFLYVANQQSNDITGFSINPISGGLVELPGSPYSIGSQPVAMGVDPTSRFLYVSGRSAQGQGLFEFTIDGSTGVLVAASGSPESGLFATSIVFDPIGNYAYLSTGSPTPGLANPILICAINFATGMLTPVGVGQPAAGGSNTAAVSPNGNLLYSVDPATSGLDALSIGSGGQTLTETSGSPYPALNNPYSLVVHPSGNFLYVVNENQPYQTKYVPSQYDGNISAFTVAPGSGALTPVAGSPLAAGINPLSVVVDASGRFAFVTATTYTFGYTGFAQILSFAIDSVSGIPTPLSGTPWTDSAQSNGSQLAISPGARIATNPAPMISSLSPASTTATAVAFTLQVNGANFAPGASVYFGGLARMTTFVSPSELTANILASDIATGGAAVVFVFNPLPGGGASTSVQFPVFNPRPVISSLTPSSVVAGTAGFSFAVTGTGFVSGSVINFNGTPLPTSYSGPTVATTGIPVALIPVQGTASITLTNPSNGLAGGGTSNAVTLTILPPNTQPMVTSVAPSSVTAGGPAFTLTVNGSGFVQGSRVTFHLINMATTFVNSGQLTAAIPAGVIVSAGNPYVLVNNPDGIASTPVNFPVTNVPPGVGSVTPPTLPVGSTAFTLNVTGTGFLPGTPGVVGSQVLVNGNSRQTTFVSSTVLQATLLPADLNQPGTLFITVVNPSPLGGASQAVQFAVTDYSISPPASIPPITAGQTANIPLTVSPLDGPFSFPVTFGGSPLPPNATASFAPSATITPGAAPRTVSLSISTMPHTATAAIRLTGRGRPPFLRLFALSTVFLLAEYCVWQSSSPHAHLVPHIVLVLLLVALAGIAACGVAGPATPSSPQLNPATGTPAGNYTISVSAISGGISHSATVTLRVM